MIREGKLCPLHFPAFMLLLILVVVIALVAWALRLMERAIECQEFSLMLAGFLVASTAAAMMTVYFLMGHYMVYMTQTAHASTLGNQVSVADFDQAFNRDWEAFEAVQASASLP